MLVVNLAIRFALELAALAAVATWGFSTASSTAGKLALGVGVPLLLAAFWGAFVSPRASTSEGLKVVLAFAVFAVAAAALAAQERVALAAAFLAVAVVNAALLAAVEA